MIMGQTEQCRSNSRGSSTMSSSNATTSNAPLSGEDAMLQDQVRLMSFWTDWRLAEQHFLNHHQSQPGMIMVVVVVMRWWC